MTEVPHEAWEAVGKLTFRGRDFETVQHMVVESVKAAAPFIRAAALEEAAEDMEEEGGSILSWQGPHGMGAENWAQVEALRSRAEAYRERAAELRGTTEQEEGK